MKPKSVNWKNWEKLLEFLKTRRPKQINMRPVLNTEAESVVMLRKVNPKCGTVGCIAVWGAVLWGTNSIIRSSREMIDFLQYRLNLDPDESDYVVQGAWGAETIDGHRVAPHDRASLGKRAVIRYMTKALKERDVMVKL